MREDLYINKPGLLKRNGNTLKLESKDFSRFYPIENINSIHIFSEVTMNSKLMRFLGNKMIPIYFYSYYGTNVGKFIPKKNHFSGKLFLKQAGFYKSFERIEIAKEIVKSTILNEGYLLKKNKIEIGDKLSKIIGEIEKCRKVDTLRAYEGNFKKFYLKKINSLIRKSEFKFKGREKNPPTDLFNSLLSLGNTLLYNVVLTEILKTKISPFISYVHEPSDNGYTLQLDLADIFKPLLVDALILNLINTGTIKKDNFETIEKRGIQTYRLNKEGLRIFINYFYQGTRFRFFCKKKRNYFSVRYFIRLDVYKIIEYLEKKIHKLNFFNWESIE